MATKKVYLQNFDFKMLPITTEEKPQSFEKLSFVVLELLTEEKPEPLNFSQTSDS